MEGYFPSLLFRKEHWNWTLFWDSAWSLSEWCCRMIAVKNLTMHVAMKSVVIKQGSWPVVQSYSKYKYIMLIELLIDSQHLQWFQFYLAFVIVCWNLTFDTTKRTICHIICTPLQYMLIYQVKRVVIAMFNCSWYS